MVWDTAVHRHVEIDLGDDWSVPAETRAPRPRLNPRWLLLVAAALVLLAGGAAAPRSGWPAQLARVPGGPRVGPVGAVGNVLVVAEQSRLVAYRIPGGRRLWQVSADEEDFVVLAPAARVVLSQRGEAPDDTQIVPSRASLQARDLDTGRLLWETSAYSTQLDPDSGELILAGRTGDAGIDLRAVDPRSGAVRWSRRLPQPAQLIDATAGSGPAELIIATGDGTVQALDPGTGRLLRSAYLPQLVTTTAGGELASYVTGDLLLLTSYGARPAVYAYDLATLTLRWSKAPLDTALYLSGCGPVLCGQGDLNSLTGYDPRNGDLLWSTFSGYSWPMPGGLLLVSDSTDGDAQLVDALTLAAPRRAGQLAADLGCRGEH